MTILSIDIDYSKVVNEYAKHNRLSIDKLLSDSRLKEDIMLKRVLMYLTYKMVQQDVEEMKRKGMFIYISDTTIFQEIGKVFNLHFTNVKRNIYLCSTKFSHYKRLYNNIKSQISSNNFAMR